MAETKYYEYDVTYDIKKTGAGIDVGRHTMRVKLDKPSAGAAVAHVQEFVEENYGCHAFHTKAVRVKEAG